MGGTKAEKKNSSFSLLPCSLLFGRPREAPSHRRTATEHDGRRRARAGFKPRFKASPKAEPSQPKSCESKGLPFLIRPDPDEEGEPSGDETTSDSGVRGVKGWWLAGEKARRRAWGLSSCCILGKGWWLLKKNKDSGLLGLV
ncbi:hypothetical protein ES332_A11G237400v1 [Gossypium tomentosum]|uniref:Uncharacterized protein n=1 Tax=Gossypium tomentosum TaxID=34277 RepID=A0A5D2NI94_GOSTO|nr:hypothetical protein ES332_A11G237400v1 [Gossypium tomentosum]